MHLVLKQETTRPTGDNLLQQQERFDEIVDQYNFDRPHEVLEQRPPADFYAKSPRPFPDKLTELNGDDFVEEAQKLLPLDRARGRASGPTRDGGRAVLVTFAKYDLGHCDCRTKRFEPLEAKQSEKAKTEAA